MKALTIAFEGSDGTGKKTQSTMLTEFLERKGKKVVRISFPRYEETLGGRLLHEVMKGPRAEQYSFSKVEPEVASLLFTMDRRESRDYVEELIATNDVVIFDRYVESNLLHQGGKFKTEEERKEFARWLFSLEYSMLKLPNPQVILYLAIPFWLSRKRAQMREENGGDKLDAVEKDIDYVKAGHDAGLFYATLYGWRIINGIEGNTELSEVMIHKLVLNTLKDSFFTTLSLEI